jgi:hypothetical protein
MLAHDCLNHPWLKKDIKPTPKPNADDKIINTKNLRRFVIRRRWQVSYFCFIYNLKNFLFSDKKFNSILTRKPLMLY